METGSDLAQGLAGELYIPSGRGKQAVANIKKHDTPKIAGGKAKGVGTLKRW